MTNIEDILQFRFSSSTFKQSAENIIPQSLKALLDFRIDKLQKINDSLINNPFPIVPAVLIPQIFRKFKESIKTTNLLFDRRELRTLTYSLSYSENNLQTIFCNENELKIALGAMETNWRDSFLSGLIDCLLSNWETTHRKSLIQLEQFITKKLDNYSGNRSTLISFKNNRHYFNVKKGNEILGLTLARMKLPLKESTKILGVPETWFSYSYFSRVIIANYEKNKENIVNEIDSLNEVLIKHNNSITNKRLISKIIIQANKPEFLSLQEKIKNIAIKLIGDPSINSIWAPFDNANETEKQELIDSRKILNEWITKEFINLFFEKCILDERRKRFWLGYASKISSFKVYGPIHTKRLLLQDERISKKVVDARFETVLRNINVSAFIFYIENYMLIEFSKKDYAFYAYNLDSNSYPKISKQLNSVDDLLNSNMPFALKRNGGSIIQHSDEGRFSHSDGFFKNGEELRWEQVFDWWIKEYLIE